MTAEEWEAAAVEDEAEWADGAKGDGFEGDGLDGGDLEGADFEGGDFDAFSFAGEGFRAFREFDFAAASASAGAESAAAAHAQHTSDCQYCPVCHLIGAVREAAPEVGEHLTVAVNALFGAAKAAIDAYERHNTAQRRRRTSGIQHIDIE